MSILFGALLCWAGLHAARYEISLAGPQARCKRCGQRLQVVI